MDPNRDSFLVMMVYRGHGEFQVAGVPIPVGHWGHQLVAGPPSSAYIEMLTSPDACERMGISTEGLEELLRRIEQIPDLKMS